MTKRFFFLFSFIFFSLILVTVSSSQENQSEENTYWQAEAVTNAKNIAFLKNKLKMLERIVSQQRKYYFELKDKIKNIQEENSSLLRTQEEKNKYINSLKEQLAHQQKELFIRERQKAILELMANKQIRDLKRPPKVKKDDNLDKAIHINLGYAYGMKDRIQDAIEEYRLALKYDPEDKDIHYNLGYLLAKKDRYKDAIEEYKKALTGQSSDREIYYNLAIIYSTSLKDKKMADYYYEKFLSIPSVDKGSAS